MMLILRKKFPSSFFICSLGKSNAFNLPHLSSLAAAIENPPPKSSFMAEYLMNSCGFSPGRAAVVSKHISHVTSPLKPDSVRHFLKHHGFTDPEIRTLISNYPPILCADGDTTLERNLRALREMGFAEDDLRKLIARNPRALQLSSAVPRFEYWRNFLNGDMKRLVLAFRRNPGLINLDIDKGITAKISLLKGYDINQAGIGTLLVGGRGVIRKSTEMMESALKRVQELGFLRGSRMFVLAVLSLSSLRSDKLKEKMELYKSFGWSGEELLNAIRKNPTIIQYSVENIRAKMAFLVEKARCTQRYISLHPAILCYSVEKRLIPRHHVMKILESNELMGRKRDLYSIMAFSEKNFLDRIILPYEDKLPLLLETYVAACAGKVPLSYSSSAEKDSHSPVE